MNSSRQKMPLEPETWIDSLLMITPPLLLDAPLPP
jgi:hypothetical protein